MITKNRAAAPPDDEAITRKLLPRLRESGPECLSQLAVEFRTSNRRVLAALERLESLGRVSRRKHVDTSCRYEPGEERWGLATLRSPPRHELGSPGR